MRDEKKDREAGDPVSRRDFLAKTTLTLATAGALPGQEKDCVKAIERSMKKMGIELLTETFAKGFERQGAKSHVKIQGKAGESTIACDQILSTVGRRPNSENLGLERIGVKVEKGFIVVDEQRRDLLWRCDGRAQRAFRLLTFPSRPFRRLADEHALRPSELRRSSLPW